MKKIIKASLAIVAVVAVGMSSYKAFGFYDASNMSEDELLLAENVMALSDNTNNEVCRWSLDIDCNGYFTGDYKICETGGSLNVCSPKGSTTCTCGVNCD